MLIYTRWRRARLEAGRLLSPDHEALSAVAAAYLLAAESSMKMRALLILIPAF